MTSNSLFSKLLSNLVLVCCTDFEHIDWQWVVKGDVDVDIGANPSAEGGEDEGVDDTVTKVVDIVDTFRLQVNALSSTLKIPIQL